VSRLILCSLLRLSHPHPLTDTLTPGDIQQSISYPYDSSTKDFTKTIDSLRLPPDFVELLEEVPCVYYDGPPSLTRYGDDGNGRPNCATQAVWWSRSATFELVLQVTRIPLLL